MTNGINGALGRGIDGRDVDIHGIISVIRARREIPLCNAVGRGKSRFGRTHDAALRAPRGDIPPAFGRGLHKIGRTIIHKNAAGGPGRKGKLIPGRINSRAVIGQ